MAKGGNLALNIGPSPEGELDADAIQCLKEVGKWLKQNGEAIYATRATPHYNEGRLWFTAHKDGETLYAIYALPEGEKLPDTIEWTDNLPKGKVTLLQNGKKLNCQLRDGKATITLPKGLADEPIALKFQIKK